MPSYIETVKIPFGGLELINIPVEEIHVRYKAGPDPEVLVVKELWVKPRQWAKGKPLPRTYVPGSPEWELLSEQLRDVVALGGLDCLQGFWSAGADGQPSRLHLFLPLPIKKRFFFLFYQILFF